eukprot:scaffold163249_cov51-Attheya_sp.AAC.1
MYRLGPSMHDFTESTQLKTVVSSWTQREKSGQREKQSSKCYNESSVGTPWTKRIEREPIQLISSNVKRREGKKNPTDHSDETRIGTPRARRIQR